MRLLRGNANTPPDAEYVLWLTDDEPLHAQTLEECVWALQFWPAVSWADTPEPTANRIDQMRGPIGLRAALWDGALRLREIKKIDQACRERARRQELFEPRVFNAPVQPAGLRRIRQKLRDSEIFKWSSWRDHPLQTALRPVPRAAKQALNRWIGQEIFDLGFYRRFDCDRLLNVRTLSPRLVYATAPNQGRLRIALCTLSLGPGGAEKVLLSLARRFDRKRFELTLLATDSYDARLAASWQEAVDHVYDLRRFVPATEVDQVLQTMAHNWRWDALILQNSMPAYGAAAALAESAPALKKVDVLHNLNGQWDLHAETAEAAKCFNTRIVISRAGREKLLRHGSPAEAIRLIRTGIDLDHFCPSRYVKQEQRAKLGLPADARLILFAGHLVERKGPRRLVDIDRELQSLPGVPPYCFVVAGDGPEGPRLERSIQTHRARDRFVLLGQVEDIAPLLAAVDVLALPSDDEGTPLVISEALAMQVPVVSTRVGAIDEILPASCGLLVQQGSSVAGDFARALAQVLGDDALREAMGQAGRRFVEQNHSAVSIANQYGDLIEELFCEGPHSAVRLAEAQGSR